MKNTIRNIVLVSGLFTLTSFASAQAVRGAAGAAGSVRAPVLPPPSAASANLAARSATAASVRAPVTPPVSPNASSVAQTRVAAGMPAGTPNINAQTHASAQGQAAGAAFANTASNQASVALDATDTVKTIREAAFAQRERVNADIQARLDASATLVADLQARAEASGEKSRAALAKALVEVRQHEKELRASLRDSTKATKESSWGEIQSALAQNYGAYAQAVIQAEAAVQDDATAAPKS